MKLYLWLSGAYDWLLLLPMAAAAWIDYKKRIIPDSFWVAIVALYILFQPIEWQRIIIATIVLCALLGLTLILERQMKKQCLGGGDIKLLAALALAVDPLPWCMMVLIAELAALIWIGMMALRHRTAFPLPQAPFFLLGCIVTNVICERLT